MGGGKIDYNNLDAVNQAVSDNYNKNVLVPCQGCGRTFLPESLAKHIKGCKGGAAAAEKAEKDFQANKPIVKPKTLVCHICGREFGTKSLAFHLKSCKKKWEIEQQNKPPHERRPCPSTPKALEEVMTSGNKGGSYNMDKLAEYNANAMNDFNDKVLEPCPNCGRTFLPDRLQIHLRSCKQNSGMKNKIAALNAQNANQSTLPEINQKTQAAKRTEPCNLCG